MRQRLPAHNPRIPMWWISPTTTLFPSTTQSPTISRRTSTTLKWGGGTSHHWTSLHLSASLSDNYLSAHSVDAGPEEGGFLPAFSLCGTWSGLRQHYGYCSGDAWVMHPCAMVAFITRFVTEFCRDNRVTAFWMVYVSSGQAFEMWEHSFCFF